jgi:TetR/AcrR family fatty acid metabolism transcriptional regulator
MAGGLKGSAAVSRLSAENKELITTAVRNRGYESAVALIRRDGWRRFTMGKLAAEMGVAKGTVYNYFSSKDAVVGFIILCKTRQLAVDTRIMMEREPDTIVLLKQIIEKFLKHFQDLRFLHTAVFEVVQKNSENDDESMRRLAKLTEPLQELFDVLRQIFRRGMDEGVLRRGDPALDVSVFHSMLNGIAMCRDFDRQLDMADPAVCGMVCDAVLRGFIREEK